MFSHPTVSFFLSPTEEMSSPIWIHMWISTHKILLTLLGQAPYFGAFSSCAFAIKKESKILQPGLICPVASQKGTNQIYAAQHLKISP